MMDIFFETKSETEVERSISHALKSITLESARDMAREKFDYLASQGAITQTEAYMGKLYVGYADKKDCLSFHCGIRGFLSDSVSDHRH